MRLEEQLLTRSSYFCRPKHSLAEARAKTLVHRCGSNHERERKGGREGGRKGGREGGRMEVEFRVFNLLIIEVAPAGGRREGWMEGGRRRGREGGEW